MNRAQQSHSFAVLTMCVETPGVTRRGLKLRNYAMSSIPNEEIGALALK